MTDMPPQPCVVCRNAFTPTDPRHQTCSGACKTAKARGGRLPGIERRRIWARDAKRVLGVTERELRYWIKQYVPDNGERGFGRPSLTFADLFWVAYIARRKAAGLSAQSCRKAIPRVQALLEKWGHPLSHTVLHEDQGLLLFARGECILNPAARVVVDGPALAHLILVRHKKRVRPYTGGRTPGRMY